MRELYERLIMEGEAGIEKLIAERTQESVQLDFKRKSDPAHGAFNDDDRRILAKTISAFANSAGGLLIWGVDASKGADHVDCAQAPPIPIAEIERFASTTRTLVGQLLQPKHDGIEVAAILSNREHGAGYLLVYVERSERRPHRSEAKNNKQYFKRAGDNTFEMEHYDIEDAFRRNSVPQLELEVHLEECTGRFDQLVFTICFSLRNDSNMSATMAYVAFEAPLDYDFQRAQNLGLEVRGDRKRVCVTETRAAINPGLSRLIVPARLCLNRIAGINQFAIKAADLKFAKTIWFGCLNSPSKEQHVEIPHARLLAMVPPHIEVV